jgi:hypothetical protein
MYLKWLWRVWAGCIWPWAAVGSSRKVCVPSANQHKGNTPRYSSVKWHYIWFASSLEHNISRTNIQRVIICLKHPYLHIHTWILVGFNRAWTIQPKLVERDVNQNQPEAPVRSWNKTAAVPTTFHARTSGDRNRVGGPPQNRNTIYRLQYDSSFYNLTKKSLYLWFLQQVRARSIVTYIYCYWEGPHPSICIAP